MKDSMGEHPTARDAESPPAEHEWRAPKLTLLGDARTLTMKGNPAGPLDSGGTAGDTSP